MNVLRTRAETQDRALVAWGKKNKIESQNKANKQCSRRQRKLKEVPIRGLDDTGCGTYSNV